MFQFWFLNLSDNCCIVQVLPRCSRSSSGVWHCQAPDLWECRALAEGAAWPCRQQHRHHVSGQQKWPEASPSRAHWRGPGLRRWVSLVTRSLKEVVINSLLMALTMRVAFPYFRKEQPVFHWDFSFGLHKCWRGFQKYTHRYGFVVWWLLCSRRCQLANQVQICFYLHYTPMFQEHTTSLSESVNFL